MLNPLPANRPVSGHAEFRNWIYYFFESTGSAFSVRVVQPNQGDVDLYIRKAERPDGSHYDFADLTTDSNVTIDVPANNQPTRWCTREHETFLAASLAHLPFPDIGLFGFQSTDYTITLITRQSSCPEDCNGHGDCSNNQCLCRAGWAGLSCGTAIEEITPNTWTTEVTLAATQWKYVRPLCSLCCAASAPFLTCSAVPLPCQRCHYQPTHRLSHHDSR